MDKTTDPRLAFPFLGPTLAALSAGSFALGLAKEFVGHALGGDEEEGPEPSWTTPNTIAVELNSVRLRDFSAATARKKRATLVCAPFALHGATIADFAPDHSLVAAFLAAGLDRLYVTDWRSADSGMRFLSIDSYLADLNVLVDHLGTVDLVGLCQGGWMALIYAARFPHKVGRLVLAGAPIDTGAEPSSLSRAAQDTPSNILNELIGLGGGRMLGRHALRFWGPHLSGPKAIQEVLQSPHPVGSPAFQALAERFHDWYRWTLDLPGTYYVEVVERLFRQNQLAAGGFVALGRTIDLTQLTHPLFLVAARDDEVVVPAQVFAVERLVNASRRDIRKLTVPCGHLGLFMGRPALTVAWPQIAHWLMEPADPARHGRHRPGDAVPVRNRLAASSAASTMP